MHIETCIGECVTTAKIANRCFDLCLAEQHNMADCIRLTSECSTFCHTTANALERNSPFIKEMCTLCAQICEACATVCEQHADMHEHCKKCAEACTRCQEVCELMAAAI